MRSILMSSIFCLTFVACKNSAFTTQVKNPNAATSETTTTTSSSSPLLVPEASPSPSAYASPIGTPNVNGTPVVPFGTPSTFIGTNSGAGTTTGGCVTAPMIARGSRGGSAGLGNPGEKLYAYNTLPTNINMNENVYVKNIQFSDYALIDPYSLQVLIGGQTFNIRPVADSPAVRVTPGSSVGFSVTISQNPRENTAQQYIVVVYQLQYTSTTGGCQ